MGKPRPPKEEQERTTEGKRLFLEAFEKTRLVVAASSAASIDRSTYYAWRRSDAAFRRAVEEIKSARIELIEDRLLSKGLHESNVKSLTYLHAHLSKRQERQSANARRIAEQRLTKKEIEAERKRISEWFDNWDAKVAVPRQYLAALEAAAAELSKLRPEFKLEKQRSRLWDS